MKNKITKNLITFGTLFILIIGFRTAFAYEPYVPWTQSSQFVVNNYNPGYTELPTWTPTMNATQVPATTIKPSVKTVNNNTNTTTTKNTVISVNKRLPNTNEGNVINAEAPKDQMNSNYPYNNGSQLTALSLNGSGSFMPSSIWQWLIVILLILAIVIIVRMLGRKSEHQETHTVMAH